MSFFDWTDHEGLYGLLVEYVADQRSESDDPERVRFLANLLQDLEALRDRFALLAPAEGAASLQEIRTSIDAEFEADPVVEHLTACIEELERVQGS